MDLATGTDALGSDGAGLAALPTVAFASDALASDALAFGAFGSEVCCGPLEFGRFASAPRPRRRNTGYESCDLRCRNVIRSLSDGIQPGSGCAGSLGP